MAETDNNTQTDGVNDPLKMRNTETSALKRMPVSANTASASSAARKTIKLKPLMPASGSGAGGEPAAPVSGFAGRSVPPPSLLMNRKMNAAPVEEPPKFMSTNTAPIGKMTKPDPARPIPAAELGEKVSPTKTVSIPRLKAKPVAVPTPAPAPAAPAASTTATVTVPKITKPAPAPAPAAPTVSTATVVTPRMANPAPAPAPAPAAPAASTTATVTVPKITKPAPVSVKPTYQSTATSAVPTIKPAVPAGAPLAEALSGKTAGAETPSVPPTTQGIQKQAISKAKIQSGIQDAKPAIKLRPSASPTQSAEVLSAASPTIKLSPKTESTVTPVPPPAPAAPADAASEKPEAAKPEDITVTAKIPRAKLQLKPSKPAMPAAPAEGAQLREQGDIANRLKQRKEEENEQTIAQASLDHADSGKKKSAKAAGEPHLIFAICAILAFLVIGYMVFAQVAQYLNTWEKQQIPVVGFEQLDKSLAK